jgi:hypothetical protein
MALPPSEAVAVTFPMPRICHSLPGLGRVATTSVLQPARVNNTPVHAAINYFFIFLLFNMIAKQN